jgi:ectoine hydroxylase-related dioxygenase (phytanoyl-CoA dioxygenase family)
MGRYGFPMERILLIYCLLEVSAMFRHVQCVLNFADNVAEDGGTIVVPYFHRYMTKWCEVHKNIRKNLPWVTLPKDVESRYMPYAHRISMKEVCM